MAAADKNRFSVNFSKLTAAWTVTKLLGYLRDAFFVAVFGGGWLADAYYAAFRVINVFRRSVGEGGVNTVFVPALSRKAGDGKEMLDFFSSVWTALFLVSLFMCCLGIILSRPITALAAPAFLKAPAQFVYISMLTAFFMPHLFFVNVTALFTSALNMKGRFFMPAVIPSVFSLSVIIYLLLLICGFFSGLGPETKVFVTVVLASFSGLLQFLLFIPVLRKAGFPLRFSPLGSAIKVFPFIFSAVPAGFIMAQDQLAMFVNTVFAGFMPAGSITAVYNSSRLAQFPISLFSSSAAAAALPQLSKAAGAKDYAGFNRQLARAFSVSGLLLFPAAFGCAVIAVPLCRLLFEHGNFQTVHSIITAEALTGISIGLPAFGIIKISSSALYALNRKTEPFLIISFQLALNAVLCFFLARYRVFGLMAATSVSSWTAALLFLAALKKRSGYAVFSCSAVKILIAAFLCGAAAYLCAYTLSARGSAVQVFSSVPAAVFIYFLALKVMRTKELSYLTGGGD